MKDLPPASCLVHVSSTESREIHALSLDATTGRLRLFEVLAVPGSGAPTRGNIPMTWRPDREVLYAHVRIAPFPLSAFARDAASDRLTLVGTVPLPAPMAYLSITRDGQFLLGASYDGALVAVHRLEPDGWPVEPCLQTLSTPPKAHCIIEAPFGGFVYATSVDGDAILHYRLDPVTGRLEAATPALTATRPGAGPRHLVFHPKLNRLYCVNEHAGTLSVYGADPTTGALQTLDERSLLPPDFQGNALAADLHLTPDGAFAYASVRKTHSISAFHVDPLNGEITGAGTFEVEPSPRGFAIDPHGRFLLCAGQDSHQLAVYAINPTHGGLELVERHPVGQRPSWIEIVPERQRR